MNISKKDGGAYGVTIGDRINVETLNLLAHALLNKIPKKITKEEIPCGKNCPLNEWFKEE